jgi:hypothetical protein
MPKHLPARLRYTIEGDAPVLLCEVKFGKRYRPIAKRYPGKNWINVEPGYAVTGSEPGTDYGSICIEYTPVEAH